MCTTKTRVRSPFGAAAPTPRRWRRWGRLLSAFVALSVSACFTDVIFSPEHSALDAAKARWANVGPPSGSYILQQQVLCFCPTGGTSYTVTVTRGSVAAARNTVTGEAVSASQLAPFRSVEQLFEEVRIALDTPPSLSQVEYDPVAGYPTRLALNSHLRAVDGEVVYISQRLATP